MRVGRRCGWWVPSLGLLKDAIGVALSLVSAISTTAPSWDRLLLCDGESVMTPFLRRKGVHEAEWRATATAALRPPSMRARKTASVEARWVRDLERELARKEKALAEAAALLVLKKAQATEL